MQCDPSPKPTPPAALCPDLYHNIPETHLAGIAEEGLDAPIPVLPQAATLLEMLEDAERRRDALQGGRVQVGVHVSVAA